jgi:hypothetical protein
MTGDAPDILARLKAVLPTRWFADETPVLDGMLAGLAWGWAWAYSLLRYAAAQTRIATATDVWLDVIARDFFGARLCRRAGELDQPFRNRIARELLRERGTRGSIVSVLTDLTGRVPRVFEPARATDTGAYGSLAGAGGGLGWGIAGGWGNLSLPFQCFISAYRPSGSGIASVAGWGGSLPISGMGAYGIGTIEYGSLDMLQGQVTDADIYKAVAEVMPVASIGWMRISS